LPVTFSGREGSTSALVLFASADGGHTWKSDKVVPNLEETSPGQSIAAAVVDSFLITATVFDRTTLTLTTMPSRGSDSSMSAHISAVAFAVRQASFVNKSQGWVLTSKGLFATADEGITWANITPPRTLDLVSGMTATKLTPRPASSDSSSPTVSAGPTSIPRNVNTRMGFDKGLVPLPGAMTQWWKSSPYFNSSLYLPGAANKRKDPNLNKEWVKSVVDDGWGLIPIWVGPQAAYSNGDPCYISDIKYVTIAPKDPYSQGQVQAKKAIAAAKNLSPTIALGTIIYYDMENYNSTPSGCGNIVEPFLSGWINGMHSQGYLAGVYSGFFPMVQNISKLSTLPDDVWIPLAHNQSQVTIWGLASGGTALCDVFSQKKACKPPLWSSDQRIVQFVKDVSETWGGQELSPVDADIVNADVSVPSVTAKPYIFDNASYTSINIDGAVETYVSGINDAGQIVGSYFDAKNNLIGFVYVDGNVVETLSQSGWRISAYAINNKGQVAGTYLTISDDKSYGFIYTNGNYNTVSLGDNTNTVAFGINDAGQIVGSYHDSDGYHGFLYDSNTHFTTQAPDNGGINGDALIAGWDVLYDAATGAESNTSFVAVDLNNSLEMFGNISEYGGILYDYYSGGMIPIAVPNVMGYLGAGGINDCGQVVGTYADSSQNTHGFLATPTSVDVDDCPLNLLAN
jgi:probable HAF family extracellular repeat protein